MLAFALFWNDFTNPVLYLYRPQTYTLPIGVQILKQMDATNWPLLMAGAIFMTLPVVVLFLLLQPLFSERQIDRFFVGERLMKKNTRYALLVLVVVLATVAACTTPPRQTTVSFMVVRQPGGVPGLPVVGRGVPG